MAEAAGEIILVLFCFDTCRDEEKETQNINVVGKKPGKPWEHPRNTLGKKREIQEKPRRNLAKICSCWFAVRLTLEKLQATRQDG